MRIKIVSDGTPQNTRIENEETGELVEGVKSIHWEISGPECAVATLEFIHVPVELGAEIEL